jgi:hypothetical protein
MWNKCEKCVADKNMCGQCRDNPEVQKILASLPKSSHFIPYVPICPRGFVDCVWDPAYILYTDPDWYKELYGDKTPLEALWVDGGCMEKIEKDHKMEKYYCYDDEDK